MQGLSGCFLRAARPIALLERRGARKHSGFIGKERLAQSFSGMLSQFDPAVMLAKPAPVRKAIATCGKHSSSSSTPAASRSEPQKWILTRLSRNP